MSAAYTKCAKEPIYDIPSSQNKKLGYADRRESFQGNDFFSWDAKIQRNVKMPGHCSLMTDDVTNCSPPIRQPKNLDATMTMRRSSFALCLSTWLSCLAVLTLLVVPCCSFTPFHLQNGRKRPILCSTNSPSDNEQQLILCIGDVLLDCIADDDARGWSVEKMSLQKKWTAFPGGANANVATACCKLGTSAAFCGCIGTDVDGDLLENLLQETGVDVSLIQRTDQLPTRRVMVTRSMNGERAFGGFADNRAAHEFADCLLDSHKLFPLAYTILDKTTWMTCGTLGLAFDKTKEATMTLVETGLKRSVQLLVDVNWRPVFWQAPESEARQAILELVQKANAVKLTDEEAEWLFGVPAAEALENPRRVHDEFPNASTLLITAGEKGASYSLFGCTGRLEAFHVDVVETTGAGDAFTAGFLHALEMVGDVDSLSQDEREEVAKDVVTFASAVGALTCTKEGAIAAQPTLDQVESFLIHGEKVWS